MGFVSHVVKTGWRSLPEGLRAKLRVSRPAIALRTLLCRLRWRHSTHDQIYDEDYFRFVDRTTEASSSSIAGNIIESFRPNTVIDFGCGTGALLDAFRSQEVQGYGFEFATFAVQFCQARQLDVVQANLADESFESSKRADVAISMEVGHQLPSQSADCYVNHLTRAADVVVFSSETPGGGDKYPLNEQPHEYWIEKFQARGFAFDASLSLTWRKQWKEANVASWFVRNVMVFRKSSQVHLHNRVR